MSVVRVHKTKNFTVMSNTHFKEKAMSLKAKGLLSLMLSLPDDWDYSIAGLVKLSKDGKDSVMTALAELEEFGYLTRSRKTDSKGRFSGVEYQIYEEPFTVAEKPHTDKPHTDEAYEENQPQLNTKLTNNLNNKELNKSNKDSVISPFKKVLEDVKDEEVKELLLDFAVMRESINSPISARGMSMLINRLERLTNFDVELQKKLLENAIINNWRNIYLPKEDEEKPKKEPGVYNREQRYSKSGYDALKNFNLKT